MRFGFLPKAPSADVENQFSTLAAEAESLGCKLSLSNAPHPFSIMLGAKDALQLHTLDFEFPIKPVKQKK